ncbi:MAG: protein phosphatase 2C domain-containing protein [Henriciella sp.]|nr:protein phosphatase 2C domain-containing protein [Henriciella sp.]
MQLLESINSPGKGVGTGDDRFGFDEAGGRAWVLDGSTDVGGRRVMASEESDAAWFAQALSEQFALSHPERDEAGRDYISRVISLVAEKAARHAREDLSQAPRYCLPTAAGVWLRRPENGKAEILSLGDCICLIETRSGVELVGYMEKPQEEADGARKLLQLSDTGRLAALQAQRAAHNTPEGYWAFGLQTEAAAHALHRQFEIEQGARAVLMSDGLFRLVTPYEVYTPETLYAEAARSGLAPLLNQLRELETSSDDNARMGRLKTSDDACALLVGFD